MTKGKIVAETYTALSKDHSVPINHIGKNLNTCVFRLLFALINITYNKTRAQIYLKGPAEGVIEELLKDPPPKVRNNTE